MTAEVDVMSAVAMEDIDQMPLSSLPPLSPASDFSQSSSVSSLSTPTSPVDSDTLSAASSAALDLDRSAHTCAVDSESGSAVDKLLSSVDCMSSDEDELGSLLCHVGEGAMLHPLVHTAAFQPSLSFAHFIHFLNKPNPTFPAPMHQDCEQRALELQTTALPFVLPTPSASERTEPTTSTVVSSPTTINNNAVAARLTRAQAAVKGASTVTFTLGSASMGTLPMVKPSSIRHDYEQLQPQRKRSLRVRTKPSTTQPQSDPNPLLISLPSPSSPSAVEAILDDAAAPSAKRGRRPTSRASESGSKRSRSSGKRRKRSPPVAQPSGLKFKLKRVRTEAQPQPPPVSAVDSNQPLPSIEPSVSESMSAGASGAEGKPVPEDRETRKIRQEWERFMAMEAKKKQRNEWQVVVQEPPAAEPAASPIKAVDTAEDILSAAERHDERLARIQAAPLLTPTAAEFRNPMRYICHVVNKYRQFGVVCIRPPEGWRPAYEYTLDKEGMSFPCKKQVIKRYYKLEAEEEEAKEERKETEAEATVEQSGSRLDAIALQVSALSHNERLTMAEFRRDEAQRRVEWEVLKAKWQDKAHKRQHTQPTNLPAGTVVAQLVIDTPSASLCAVSSSLPSPLTVGASVDVELAVSRDGECLVTIEAARQGSSSATTDSTSSSGTVCLADDGAFTASQPGTTTVALPVALAAAVLAPLLPQPPPPSAALTHAQMESDYWRWAMLYGKTRPAVYYANDVDTHPEQRTPLPPLPPTSPFLTAPPSPHHPWDLSALNSLPSSFLHHLDRSIPGITAPMLYIGMLHSTFCWHHEDAHLYSVSYNHAGSTPKTWYGVPGSHCAAVEQLANRSLYPFFDSTRSHLLARKTSMFSPALLHEAGVPVYRAVQEEGMFVITFPRAYHCGFSHGFSLAESVNFALDDWLPDGGEATRMYRQLSQFPVVPFTELVVRAVEAVVRVRSSAECEDDIGVDGLVRLERTFAELVLDELNEREALYGSGRHPYLSLAHLRCQSATRYCKTCLHATYLSHVRCDCRVGGGTCLSGHGLCRTHRENSEVVLAYLSVELTTLLSDMQRVMFSAKRAAAGLADDASVAYVPSSEDERAELRQSAQRFDFGVALATSLSEREHTAVDMAILLADQPDDDDDEQQPRRRMSGGGAGAGAGAGRRRRKRALDMDVEQPSEVAAVPATDAVGEAQAMVVDGESSEENSDSQGTAELDGRCGDVSGSVAATAQLMEEAADTEQVALATTQLLQTDADSDASAVAESNRTAPAAQVAEVVIIA